MRSFDTRVQELKYQVLKEVVRLYLANDLENGRHEIPKKVVPGPKATLRCCIYHERAIVEERVRLAMGGDKSNENIVEVLDSACEECPVKRFSVTDACRGCIAHKCEHACPVGAISFEKHKSVIDPEKCIECGKCMKACPYNAIIESQRPCVRSCTAKAITIDSMKKAKIDNSKCTNCGACVSQCPFGALVDKSNILEVLKLLKESSSRVYAILAPSIASQFTYSKIGQVITGLKNAGFYKSVEVALGADITAVEEAQEFAEKGFLLSSCCPAYVRYVKINFPQLADKISETPSPMIETAMVIKKKDPDAKVVFIGPCIAKKMEARYPENSSLVDNVLTFEELQALLDGMDIDIEKLPEGVLEDASGFGRGFAKSGGVAAAVARVIKEKGLKVEFNPELCNGAEQYRIALLKASKGKLGKNYIEGMACEGGCIGGAACINHDFKSAMSLEAHAKQAKKKNVLPVDLKEFSE